MKYKIAALVLVAIAAVGVILAIRKPEEQSVSMPAPPAIDREEEDEERHKRLETAVSNHWPAVTPAPTPAPAKPGIFTAEEQQGLQAAALQAAQLCAGVYSDLIIANAGTKNSRIEGFTHAQGREAAKQLGAGGLISVAENCDMENYEILEAFYSAYSAGEEALATVFCIQEDGSLTARSFLHRSGAIGTYFVTICWQEGGVPEIRGIGETELAEMRMTEKGYFFYSNADYVAHGTLMEYFRVRPLAEACRALTEACLSGMSYVNYNMLITNWDESNVEDIVVPRMFEDLYWMDTGENFRTEDGQIPAALYEDIMTAYLPVTAERLREISGYNRESDSYTYDMIFPARFPPFGEVVDFTQNEDGTITLFVDGVWPDYGSDYAFTSQIVIQPLDGGRFRFLSNAIEKRELELPAVQ